MDPATGQVLIKPLNEYQKIPSAHEIVTLNFTLNESSKEILKDILSHDQILESEQSSSETHEKQKLKKCHTESKFQQLAIERINHSYSVNDKQKVSVTLP